jgi:predicted enzyme related to lactoylglutathione lyase
MGEAVRQNEIVTDIAIAGGLIWDSLRWGREAVPGLAWRFRWRVLFAGCAAVKAAGGEVLREPEDTPEEPARILAMCVDSEGNEIMLTKARHR